MNGKEISENTAICQGAEREVVRECLTFLKCGKSAYKQNDVIYSAETSNGIMPKHTGDGVGGRNQFHSTYTCTHTYQPLWFDGRTRLLINAHTQTQDNCEFTSMNNQSCQNPSVNPIQYISIHSLICHSLVYSLFRCRNNGRRCVRAAPKNYFRNRLSQVPTNCRKKSEKVTNRTNFYDSHSI